MEKVVVGSIKSCGCGKGKYKGVDSIANSIYCEYKCINLSFEEFLILVKQNCYYCGCAPSNHRRASKNCTRLYESGITFDYNGLDRIDNNGGHSRDNVVVSCWKCNEIKGKMSTSEFIDWVEKVYNTSREKNPV